MKNKNISIALFFLGIFLPQLFIKNYPIIIGAWIIVGAFADVKKIFIKSFAFQLLIGALLIYGLNRQNVFIYLNAPHYLFSVLFILFNALNVAICLSAGRLIAKMTKPVLNKVAQKEEYKVTKNTN